MSDLDWQEIYSRLDRSREQLDESLAYSPEEHREILKERARLLAKADAASQEGVESIEVVEFKLAHEHYAVDCNYISEVYPLKTLTPIPGTPEFVLGIINVRGQIISVIDLKTFFELPDKGLSDLTRVIILRDDNMEFGILAEEVMGTVIISPDQLQPPLPTLTGSRSDYLKGIARDRLIVLDAARLLEDEKIIVQQEMES